MTHTEAMKQALELLDRQWQCSGAWSLEESQDVADVLRQAIEQAEQSQPVAIIASLMPAERNTLIGEGHSLHDALYTAPPPRKPLTDEQEYEAIGTAGVDLLELAKQWADNEIHVYQFDNEARKIIKAVLRRAHGIKGDA